MTLCLLLLRDIVRLLNVNVLSDDGEDASSRDEEKDEDAVTETELTQGTGVYTG